MVRLRKWIAYRKLERPYTRISKYREKSYVRMRPQSHIVRYNMGNPQAKFTHSLILRSKSDLQIRDNSIESARLTANRMLEAGATATNYYFIVRCYPHHILRENPLATGAGADRFSTGMQKAFGKPIGVAARIYVGKPIFQINVNEPHLGLAKQALIRAKTKLPCACKIEITKIV